MVYIFTYRQVSFSFARQSYGFLKFYIRSSEFMYFFDGDDINLKNSFDIF